MRVIKSDSSGIYFYQKILKHVQAKGSPFVVWQLIPETGQRNKTDSRLNSFHFESGLMHFEVDNGSLFQMELPIYFYSEEGQFIFKSQFKEIRPKVFTAMLPSEIKLIEDPEVNQIRTSIGMDISTVWKTNRMNLGGENLGGHLKVKSMAERTARDQEFLTNEFNSVSLDEEDRMFADKRESPRARPKVEKWVKVIAEGNEEVHYLKLFDLSQGGIGFITFEPQYFPKGCKIKVVGFDQFDLDDPLIAEVMSQRPIDDLQIEFKIGCKFDEGQA